METLCRSNMLFYYSVFLCHCNAFTVFFFIRELVLPKTSPLALSTVCEQYSYLQFCVLSMLADCKPKLQVQVLERGHFPCQKTVVMTRKIKLKMSYNVQCYCNISEQVQQPGIPSDSINQFVKFRFRF